MKANGTIDATGNTVGTYCGAKGTGWASRTIVFGSGNDHTIQICTGWTRRTVQFGVDTHFFAGAWNVFRTHHFQQYLRCCQGKRTNSRCWIRCLHAFLVWIPSSGTTLACEAEWKKTHTQHVSVRENLKRKDKRKIGHECTLMNHLNSCPSYVCTLRTILTRRRIGIGSHVQVLPSTATETGNVTPIRHISGGGGRKGENVFGY